MNSFVDHDMFVRYIGGGAGHQDITDLIQMCDELEEADEWEVDTEPQDVCSEVEDGDCDPDDEDIGLDIDDKYDEL